jgi:hypothetical protein
LGREKASQVGAGGKFASAVSVATTPPWPRVEGTVAGTAPAPAAAPAAAPVHRGSGATSTMPPRGSAQQMGRSVVQSSKRRAPEVEPTTRQRPAVPSGGMVLTLATPAPRGVMPHFCMSAASMATRREGGSPPPSARPLYTTTSPTSAERAPWEALPPQLPPRQSFMEGALGAVAYSMRLAAKAPSTHAAALVKDAPPGPGEDSAREYKCHAPDRGPASRPPTGSSRKAPPKKKVPSTGPAAPMNHAGEGLTSVRIAPPPCACPRGARAMRKMCTPPLIRLPPAPSVLPCSSLSPVAAWKDAYAEPGGAPAVSKVGAVAAEEGRSAKAPHAPAVPPQEGVVTGRQAMTLLPTGAAEAARRYHRNKSGSNACMGEAQSEGAVGGAMRPPTAAAASAAPLQWGALPLLPPPRRAAESASVATPAHPTPLGRCCSSSSAVSFKGGQPGKAISTPVGRPHTPPTAAASASE